MTFRSTEDVSTCVVLALHVLPPAFDPWSLELSTALYSYVPFSHLLHRSLIMVHLLDNAYRLYFTLIN